MNQKFEQYFKYANSNYYPYLFEFNSFSITDNKKNIKVFTIARKCNKCLLKEKLNDKMSKI